MYQAASDDYNDVQRDMFIRRMAGPFVRNGLVREVRVSDTQLTDDRGRPVNGAIHHDTGIMWLSRNMRANTVGHEAAHRILGILGENDPLVQEAVSRAGGVEQLADMIGGYYTDMKLNLTSGSAVYELLKNATAKASRLLGVEKTMDDLVREINFGMVSGQKVPSTSLERVLVAGPMSEEDFIEPINPESTPAVSYTHLTLPTKA